MNGIVKDGSIHEDWKSCLLVPVYMSKDNLLVHGSNRGIKLLEHAINMVVERVFEYRIQQQAKIDDKHCSLVICQVSV